MGSSAPNSCCPLLLQKAVGEIKHLTVSPAWSYNFWGSLKMMPVALGITRNDRISGNSWSYCLPFQFFAKVSSSHSLHFLLLFSCPHPFSWNEEGQGDDIICSPLFSTAPSLMKGTDLTLLSILTLVHQSTQLLFHMDPMILGLIFSGIRRDYRNTRALCVPSVCGWVYTIHCLFNNFFHCSIAYY